MSPEVIAMLILAGAALFLIGVPRGYNSMGYDVQTSGNDIVVILGVLLLCAALFGGIVLFAGK